MKNKLIDQSRLAESVAAKINFEFARDFLVKPLDPVKVKKEFSEPVTNNKAKKDEDGIEAVDYDKVKTEVREVDSDYSKGVVLKIPHEYTMQSTSDYTPFPIKVGDVILYRSNAAKYFDLVKDTQVIRSYDVIGKETTQDNG